MGVTGVLAGLNIAGTAAGVWGSYQQGRAEREQAEANAQIYEAQARNIQEQQKIVAGQYRTKANVLRGQATTDAARSGLRISGTTANSISQSIMELQMDNSYQQYNLATQRQEAFDNAALQRYQGKQAYRSGLFKAGATALSGASDFYNKYWKTPTISSSGNSAGTWFKGQANKIKSWGNTKLSGGLPTTNKQMIQGSGIVRA
jgi:hypothetical protein